MPDVGPVVLIAGTPDAIAAARSALGESYSYRLAGSLDDALRQVSRDIDLILVNVAFDDSRMFDFVRAVRSSGEGGSIPIICFRHHERPLNEATHHAIELAVGQVARTSFLDLYALKEKGGVAVAMSQLRQAVSRALSGRPG